MKIEVTNYRKKYSVETEFEDVAFEEYLEFFKGLLILNGFHERTVTLGFIEYAESLKEEDN